MPGSTCVYPYIHTYIYTPAYTYTHIHIHICSVASPLVEVVLIKILMLAILVT